MFCKKCHKRIIKKIKTVNTFKNTCSCSDKLTPCSILTDTEMNGFLNSYEKKRKIKKMKKMNEKKKTK